MRQPSVKVPVYRAVSASAVSYIIHLPTYILRLYCRINCTLISTPVVCLHFSPDSTLLLGNYIYHTQLLIEFRPKFYINATDWSLNVLVIISAGIGPSVIETFFYFNNVTPTGCQTHRGRQSFSSCTKQATNASGAWQSNCHTRRKSDFISPELSLQQPDPNPVDYKLQKISVVIHQRVHEMRTSNVDEMKHHDWLKSAVIEVCSKTLSTLLSASEFSVCRRVCTKHGRSVHSRGFLS